MLSDAVSNSIKQARNRLEADMHFELLVRTAYFDFHTIYSVETIKRNSIFRTENALLFMWNYNEPQKAFLNLITLKQKLLCE